MSERRDRKEDYKDYESVGHVLWAEMAAAGIENETTPPRVVEERLEAYCTKKFDLPPGTKVCWTVLSEIKGDGLSYIGSALDSGFKKITIDNTRHQPAGFSVFALKPPPGVELEEVRPVNDLSLWGNTRFYDQLMEEGAVVETTNGFEDMDLKDKFQGATVVSIDNVDAYLKRFSAPCSSVSDYKISPPFENFFLECVLPAPELVVDVYLYAYGYLWQTEFLDDKSWRVNRAQYVRVSHKPGRGRTSPHNHVFPLMTSFSVNVDGYVQPEMCDLRWSSIVENPPEYPDRVQLTKLNNEEVFALNLLNASNVVVSDHEPCGKRARKARRAGTPLTTYKVLDILPNGVRSLVELQKSGMAMMPLHLCRGHFKDYTLNGLFGKYHGIYWWREQVRGSKEFGEVYKDYRVIAGDGARR